MQDKNQNVHSIRQQATRFASEGNYHYAAEKRLHAYEKQHNPDDLLNAIYYAKTSGDWIMTASLYRRGITDNIHFTEDYQKDMFLEEMIEAEEKARQQAYKR